MLPLDEDGAKAGDIADDICHAISQAIIDCRLEPGVKLPENAIGDHFGVSRTIVRSAMNRLQRERLVELKKNHGVFVARPTVAEAKSLYDARRVIERAIVERVTGAVGPKDIEALLRHTAREDETHAGGRRQDTVRLSGDFHLRLAKLAGNEVLHGILEPLVLRSALVIAVYGNPHGHGCGANDHRDLIRAIEKRDVEAACGIMDSHLREIEASLSLDRKAPESTTLIEILSRYAMPSRAADALPAGRRAAKRPRA